MWWPFNSKYPERRPEDADRKAYDYVVVGGGTAGCVLASRLSEDLNISVLLLERGPANDTFMSRIPLASSDILRSDGGSSSWMCEPMKYCDDRRSLFFCGEVLGGGSRINSMVYTRGAAEDYNLWADMGHPDWSYEKVLPYFVKSENTLSQPKSHYRGNSGPWINQTFTYPTWLFKVYRVFTDCAESMGFGHISDTNSPKAPVNGLATFDATVNANRQRVSTFDAFLSREIALKRQSNLTICTKTIVSQITFSNNEAKPRAEQVQFKDADSASKKIFSATIKKEIIVCSGSSGSPQVLLLSGIGPREHLEELGIKVVHDLPGVGSELTDHIAIPVAWEVPVSESLTAVATHPLTKGVLEFFKYIFFRSGILSMPIQTLSLFVNSKFLTGDGTELISEEVSSKSVKTTKGSIGPRREDNIPDIELMPLATSAMDNLVEHQRLFSKIGIFSLLATLLQAKSRGTVRLASSNPHDRPKIDFGILSDPEDYIVARKAVHLSWKLGDAMKAAGFPIIRNITFPEEKRNESNNEAIDKFIRERARTTYHYSSSCRMAPEDDPKAPGVVDDELRVHGVSGLRVCDTSIFPHIISSHLQAPAVMVAEKCADMVKKAAASTY